MSQLHAKTRAGIAKGQAVEGGIVFMCVQTLLGMPAAHGLFHRAMWIQALFVIYTLLAYCALVAYAGAILSTRVRPRWMGGLLVSTAWPVWG